MKTSIFFTSMLLLFNSLAAQSGFTKGQVEYKQSLMIDTIQNNVFDSRGTLYFDAEKRQAMYVWDKRNPNSQNVITKMDDGSVRGTITNGGKGTDKVGRVVFKNFNSPFIEVRERMEEWELIEDTVQIAWVISDETKVSRDMTLQKATGDFHGRRYTAWFSPSIPIPDGPWKFKGLPGLILEVYDEKKHVVFEWASLKIPADFDDGFTRPAGLPRIGYGEYLRRKMDSLKDTPKQIEAFMKQNGIISFEGTMRSNTIERSH